MCVQKPTHTIKLCKKHAKKKTPHKQIQECLDALNKLTDTTQELVLTCSDPQFGLRMDALPYVGNAIPSQGSKDNIEIDIDHHIATQKNAE